MMRTDLSLFTYAVIVSLLVSCNFPGLSQPETIIAEVTPSMETYVPIEPSLNDEPVTCAFMWANESLPVLSADFNQTLQITLPGAEGFAEAYGENCVTETGEVVRFHAMQTEYYITLQVQNLDDRQALGELIEGVMNVMADFPTDETPGPQPGYIGITFETQEDSLRLWVMRAEVETALETGLQGEELFNALQKQ